jgi:hypothetical protein
LGARAAAEVLLVVQRAVLSNIISIANDEERE